MVYLRNFAAVDECAMRTHNCDTNAICTDTAAGFTCTCKTGYKGNGEACRGKQLITSFIILLPYNLQY